MRFLVSVTLMGVLCLAACDKKTTTLEADIAAYKNYKTMNLATSSIQEAAQAVVKISTFNASGTGSFISNDGLLMTNNHVVGAEDCPRQGCFIRIFINFQSDKSYINKEVFVVPKLVRPDLDLTVFETYEVSNHKKTDKKFTPPAYLEFTPSTAKSLLGQEVFVVGHPLAQLKKWFKSEVISTEGNWITSNGMAYGGNSGSPILSAEGKIVGIIHRAADSGTLLVKDGIQTRAIGTASAPITDAIATIGTEPATKAFTQLPEKTSTIAVLKHYDKYRNAQINDILLEDGSKTTVVDIMGAQCDLGLAKDIYTSPNDFSESTRFCSEANSWIDCDSKSKAFRVCPADTNIWKTRFEKAAARAQEFKETESQLYWLLELPSLLSQNPESFKLTATTNLDGYQATQPELSFELAYYSFMFSPQTKTTFLYQGQDLVSYVLNYRQQKNYQYFGGSLVSALYAMASENIHSYTDVLEKIKNIAGDETVPLGARFNAETRAYYMSFWK